MRGCSSRLWLLGLFYFYRLMGAYEGIYAKFRHKRVIKRKSLRVYLRGFLVGAEDEARTRAPNLGKVVLYQLSYAPACGADGNRTIYEYQAVNLIASSFTSGFVIFSEI